MSAINTAPLSNEETEKAFNAIKVNMTKALRSDEAGALARSEVIVNCIYLAAHSPVLARELVSRAAGVFADRKVNTTEYDGAWQYFTELYGLPARVNAETEPDRMMRDWHNNKVSAAQQFVRYAASIYYAIGTTNTWQAFSRGKNKSVLMLTIDGAKLLFPKRSASLDKSEYNAVPVTHRAGEYRFSSIAEAGTKMLEARGLKNKSNTTRVKPMRDAIAGVQEAVENADSKAFDAETRRVTLSTLVALLDALNDASVKDHLSSENVRPLREEVVAKLDALERAKAESTVKTAA